MASLSDVRDALAAQITAAITAAGIPGVGSVPGWPSPNDISKWNLATTLEGGQLMAVIAIADFGAPRITTRFSPIARTGALPAPTLAWTVAGDVAILSGIVTVPQNLCIFAGGIDYVRGVAATDTLSSIVAAFAADIPGATSSGAQLTAPNLAAARVGVACASLTEVGRQIATIRIGIYAGTDALRSQIINAIKPALDNLTRLTLADTSVAWVRTGTEMSVWQTTKVGIAQSTLAYQVEYPTILTGIAAQAIAWVLNVSANGQAVRTYQG